MSAMLFRAIELETRKHLSEDFLVEGRSQPIKEKLKKGTNVECVCSEDVGKAARECLDQWRRTFENNN